MLLTENMATHGTIASTNAWLRPVQIRTTISRLLLTGSARVKDEDPFAFSPRSPPIMISVTARVHISTSSWWPSKSTKFVVFRANLVGHVAISIKNRTRTENNNSNERDQEPRSSFQPGLIPKHRSTLLHLL